MQNHSSGTTSSKRRPFPILIVIILMALSSLVTYFIVQNQGAKEKEAVVAEKDEEISELTEKMEQVSQQLDEKINEAKKLGADYEALQAYKDQLEADLETLQKTTDISQAQVRQYLAKIQGYEEVIAAKDRELMRLRAQNQQLTQERDSLTTEAASLKDSTTALSSTVEKVEESNRKLSNLAATLRAENITVSAYNKRDKAESRNVFRARRIDKLTIDFVLAENKVAEAGSKAIYLRLVEPSGTVVYNTKAGSGKFEIEGKQTSYTLQQEVMYSQTRRNVQFMYDKPKDYDFKEGKYTIELYSGGKQIGYKVFKVD